MARVTVEDCIQEVKNRFELVILAAGRAKSISSGAPLTVDRDKDKNPVVALREIANGNIDPEVLRESQIISLQKNNKVDEVLEENLHAEIQESVDEEVDYSAAGEDVFASDVSDSQEAEMDFSDNFTEEEK